MNFRRALLPFLFELGVLAPSSSSSSSHDDNQHDASASSLSSSSASSSIAEIHDSRASINDDAHGSKIKVNALQQRKKLRQLHDPSPSSELKNRQDHRINGDGSTRSDASKKQDMGYLDHRRLSEHPPSDETSQRHLELTSREAYCEDLCPSERPEIQDNGTAFKALIEDCMTAGGNCPGNDAPIGCWNTSAVKDMKQAFDFGRNNDFSNDDFNEKINCWDVSSVTTMEKMFNRAYRFDQPLDGWNVAKVTNMIFMFFYASDFNQPVDDWDVSKVSSMADMFNSAQNFNQCITSWAEKTPSTVITASMLGGSDCPIPAAGVRKSSPDPNVGPWCCEVTLAPSLAPTSAPTTTLAPTSAPTTTPTNAPTASPTGACDNSAEFDCAKHITGFKKRKCSKKIRNKWGVGLKFRDVCPQMCKGQLCTCVDRVEKFSIKGVEGDYTCANLIGKRYCRKFTDIYGFAVNKICPNKCKNTKRCMNAP